ncbi:PREDICTED: occludin/ELL domain-containing protein 1 [Chinchilla lanigera]|uniref:occludin/ELL domain-containing protein 1 n=1 Tax=Chinchilla lanigera TaxID=34839 RepID=UPI000697F285|nr:PREDICTED: occludin/ELL domain-containing protein 1 [Chinchilla lanigera]
MSTGCPQATPATRGPRRSPQGPPASPGPRDRRPPKADAHLRATPGPWLSGEPAWPRTPGHTVGARRPPCQRPPAPHQARPRKITFEDELTSRALLGARKPAAAGPGVQMPRPHPVPDYELKYPPLRSERARSCYVAVFQDQHAELQKLQHEVVATQAKLQQLETRLRALPRPRSQEEARATARVWQELEKKRRVRRGLQPDTAVARDSCAQGKLRHLKTQIQKFDDQTDSEGSAYF